MSIEATPTHPSRARRALWRDLNHEAHRVLPDFVDSILQRINFHEPPLWSSLFNLPQSPCKVPGVVAVLTMADSKSSLGGTVVATIPSF